MNNLIIVSIIALVILMILWVSLTVVLRMIPPKHERLADRRGEGSKTLPAPDESARAPDGDAD